MSKKRERILIINHATKQYTLFRVIAEQTAPIQHETVIPAVEAFHVHHGSIVLHQVVPSTETISAQPPPAPPRPTPKLAAGPADPPKAAPLKRRGRPRKPAPEKKPKRPAKRVRLNSDHELLLTRAWEVQRKGGEGLPPRAVHASIAKKLLNAGLLEEFTPDGMYAVWYRITKAGIERAASIKETWL